MKIDNALKELEEIRKSVAEAKTEKATAEGVLSEQMKSLKTYNVKTVQGGKKKLETLQTKLASMEKKIVAGYEKLQESYEW